MSASPNLDDHHRSSFQYGDPSSLLKGVQKVASEPTIYAKVVDLLADPRAGSGELAAVIEKDPSLAARILRLANSAYFHQGHDVETIAQAIMVIGTTQMRDVVLASSTTTAFKDIPPGLMDMNSFWSHSIACGILARLISQLRHCPNTETAFISGLLHDIGRLILFHKLPIEMTELMRQSKEQKRPLYQLEQQAFGFDHAMLGGDLLMLWRLPSIIVDTTLHHHQSSNCVKYEAEVTTVHVADQLAKSMAKSHSGDINVTALEDDDWQRLGVTPEEIASLKPEFERQYAIAADFVFG